MEIDLTKRDLRTSKTKKAIMTSMSNLLEKQDFTKITVNELCEEAEISRTTFYLHFNDKYDLLKHWLIDLRSSHIIKKDTYGELEKSVNNLVDNNKRIFKHLIANANNESTKLLCDFMFSLFNLEKPDDGQMGQKYIILSKFVSGGIMNYFICHLENEFPYHIQIMNPYFYELLINLLRWYEM